MTNTAPQQNLSLYGLIDWLALSGVSSEVGEISAYEALQQRLQERNVGTPAVEEASSAPAKAASVVSKPLQQKHDIKQFNSLEELNTFCSGWKDFALAKTASRCVLGDGNTAPLLLVVTDMPEDDEDRNGLAFSGQSNQIIRKALSFTNIPQDKIYFSYLSKWRSPGKRNLAPHELEVCRGLLQQEIRLLNPKFILTLGESTRESVLTDDSVNNGSKNSFLKITKKQIDNSEKTILTSQKPELLVKNPAMKKNFWFSLLELAAIISADDRSH